MKKPNLEQVTEYATEKKYTFDLEYFLAYQESRGWKVGKNPMKCWKSAMTTFQKNENKNQKLDVTKRSGKFWQVMINIYGTKWTCSQGKTPSGLWAEFVDNHTDKQMRRGLLKMKSENKEWPPSLLVFEENCLPDEKELGLPDKWTAFRQSLSNQDKHPAVIYTLRNMHDVFKFRHESEEKAIKRFESHWRETVLYVERGGAFPDPEKRIDSPRKKTTKPKAINNIKKLLELVN